jgi:hypothetical protein
MDKRVCAPLSTLDVALLRAPRRGHRRLCRHVVNTRCIVLLWLRPCRVSPVGEFGQG